MEQEPEVKYITVPQNVGAVKLRADDITASKPKKTNRFPDITSEDADEIAGETEKKRAKMQTIWGVKVFRCNNFS